jgi:trimeric autotransporter adhesin
MLTGRKLALTLAFTILMVVAFGAGCRGFFQNPTVASFVISPSNATVPLDGTFQMHAFGTDSEGNPTGDITGQISWSSDESGSVSVGATTGLLSGVALSTTAATITGSYQALSAQTATASVCVENGSNFTISPANKTITGSLTPTVEYTATALVSGETVDITSGVQWSSSNTTVVTIVSGTDPAEASITDPTAQTKVLITATYSCNGTTNTFTTNLTVNP